MFVFNVQFCVGFLIQIVSMEWGAVANNFWNYSKLWGVDLTLSYCIPKENLSFEASTLFFLNWQLVILN